MNEPTTEWAGRMQRVAAACQAWITENPTRSLSLHVAQGERLLLSRGFGLVHPLADASASISADDKTIFLVASLTKPLTAAAVCLLAERGKLSLDEPVQAYTPAFRDGERHAVLVRHLLTHTSGLPDMLPENEALRRRHAPLSAFIEGTCSTPLLFAPGTGCSYQSMGTLLAAAIAERVSGLPLPGFLEQEFFRPLGMRDSHLGLGRLDQGRIARVILLPDAEAQDWTWNSAYWRGLAAPWGGLHTTAGDYARFLQLMLGRGQVGGHRLLSEDMAREMLADQLTGMPAVPARVRRKEAWGLGWRLNRPAGATGMPHCAAARCFGHGGATGTVAWADPESGLACVILTNDPQSGALRSRVSDLVAGCGA